MNLQTMLGFAGPSGCFFAEGFEGECWGTTGISTTKQGQDVCCLFAEWVESVCGPAKCSEDKPGVSKDGGKAEGGVPAVSKGEGKAEGDVSVVAAGVMGSKKGEHILEI